MSREFTFLLDLPNVLAELGLNVWVAKDWQYGQGAYLWTDPHTGMQSYDGMPHAYMVHHSASSAATPPPHDTSKASAWIGLRRDNRLYQEGGGVPTIYLASAGPARVSSGYGYRPSAWDHTFKQKRAPARAAGKDGDTALNRYSFNMETVHRGDGAPIDRGVWDHVVGLGVALEKMTGLKEMTLGHRSWSQRKIDPYWDNDHDCIVKVQEAVAAAHGSPPPVITPPPTKPPTGEIVDIGRNQEYVKENQTGQDVEYWQNIILQVVEGKLDTGNSTKTFFDANQPGTLTWKVWDKAMTEYFSAWTRRNSYGVGATERKMLEQAYIKLVAGG